MHDFTPQSLIRLHYSVPKEKNKLINYLIESWSKPMNDNKLGKSIAKLLHDNQDEVVEGPLILLLTMRNRKILREKTENSSKALNERLTGFLRHLEAQRHDIFLPDAASMAIQSSQKYTKDIGFIKMFQIERVRRIRSASGPGNYNLSFCMKILDSIKSNLKHEHSGAYGAIHMPTKALHGLIDLQLGLCKARTASYEDTLNLAKSAEDNFKGLSKEIESQELRELLLWWTHEIRERVYSQCYMMLESLEARNEADRIVNNLEDSKAEYLKKIKPDEFGKLSFEYLVKKICRLEQEKNQTTMSNINDISINDFLYAKHLLLSLYLEKRNEFKINGKYDKKQIEKLIPFTIKDDYIYKIIKKNMNQFLLSGIVGEFKRDIGLRIEPLLFDHTPLKRSDVIRRINKHCSVTLSLIQISKERDSSFLILQLILIAIDFLTKSQRLLQIYIRRDNKRKYVRRDDSSKTEEEKFAQENIEYFHHTSNQIFSEIKSAMDKKLPNGLREESKLLKWINNISLELGKIDTNSENYISYAQEFCKKAVENDGEKIKHYEGKIELNFMKVTKSEIPEKKGKPVDFYAGYNMKRKQFTPYSAIPGESKFKAD